MLRSKCDPAAMNNEAVIFAARFGYADIVEVLREKDDVFIDLANCFRQLLCADSRVDCFANRFQALTLAAKFGHARVVSLLLDE